MDIRSVSFRRPAYPLLTALSAAAVLAACDDKPRQTLGGIAAPDIAPAAEAEKEQLTSGFIVTPRPWSPPAVNTDADIPSAPAPPAFPSYDAADEVNAVPADEDSLSDF